jgi:peptidoglycan/xylan/chitin deacetylase (PgdA/CDA1 family)
MGTTILTYHVIDDDRTADAANRYITTPQALRRQFAWLRAHGYAAVPLSDLVAGLSRGVSPAHKQVAITLDDGIACCYERFLPILQEFGVPATVFVVSGRVGGYNDWDVETGGLKRRMVTSTELRALCDAGVVIGSHGVNHVRLAHLDATTMRAEIRASKAELEDLIGQQLHHFAYPYGSYTKAVTEAVQQAGYQSAFTSDFGRNRPGADLFTLRRTSIYWEDALDQFASKVRVGAPWKLGIKRWAKDMLGRE